MNDGSINKFDLWEAAQHSFSYKKMCVGWLARKSARKEAVKLLIRLFMCSFLFRLQILIRYLAEVNGWLVGSTTHCVDTYTWTQFLIGNTQIIRTRTIDCMKTQHFLSAIYTQQYIIF